MTDENDKRPWWVLPKDEQKRKIEDAIEWVLSRNTDLTNRQKLFVRDAIENAFRGLFGVAWQSVFDACEPESAFDPSFVVSRQMVEGITQESLHRALAYLKASAVRERPVFR